MSSYKVNKVKANDVLVLCGDLDAKVACRMRQFRGTWENRRAKLNDRRFDGKPPILYSATRISSKTYTRKQQMKFYGYQKSKMKRMDRNRIGERKELKRKILDKKDKNGRKRLKRECQEKDSKVKRSERNDKNLYQTPSTIS